MKIFNKNLPIWIVVMVIAGLLVGSAVAVAVSPIWSNVVNTTIIEDPWTGTVVMSAISGSYNTGQSITLIATLNPLPTQYQLQQTVTFYYSSMSGVTSASSVTGNPATGWALVGSPSTSNVVTVSGIAQLTFTSSMTGTFYFIAEVATPT